MTRTSLYVGLVLCAFVAIELAPRVAEARVTSVTINNSRQFENASNYTYAEITVSGDVTEPDNTVSHYTVPAVVIFPRFGANNVGVVDWLNSAFYHFFPPSTEFGTFQFTLLATENYLFEQGYTYISIQWNKAVTEIFGPTIPADGQPHNPLVFGTIPHGADAFEILLDAGRLLKNPSAFPSSTRPRSVGTVISSGYSQGAGMQLEVLTANRDPQRIYDGHWIQMIGLTCFKRDDVGPNFGFFGDCAPLPTSGNVPVIVQASMTDMVVFHPTVLGFGKSAFFLRNTQNSRWRSYEMAGISHLPKPILDLGLTNQNYADARPIFRKALDNLVKQVRFGVRPPSSKFFRGNVDSSNQFVPQLDRDGNWAGGLRLPHVADTVDGRPAGAPLGTFDPTNSTPTDPFNPFVFLSGQFNRFSDAELIRRYPTRADYVRRVELVTDELEEDDYISRADETAINAQARIEPLPAGINREVDSTDEGDLLAGCSASSGGTGMLWVGLVLLLPLRRRRR